MDEINDKSIRPSIKSVSKRKKLPVTDKVLTPVEIQKSIREKKTIQPEVPPIVTNTEPMKNSAYKLFSILLTSAVILLILIFVALASLISLLRKGENQVYLSTRTIQISSTPADADVYMDNHYLGLTPINLYNVNLNDEVTLRIRKDGYNEYKMSFDKFTVQNNYDVVLSSKSPKTKDISWSDFGLKLTVPENYTESLTLASAKCKDVKSYLKDSTSCANLNNTFSYNAKNLNVVDNDKKFTMSVMLPDSTNDCKLNKSKCSNAEKIDSISFLGQSVDVYKQKLNKTVIFLQPIVKTKGNDYNSLYLEFNGDEEMNYKNILNMISDNA